MELDRAATQYQRASRAWPVLTGEAVRGATLTYGQLGERIGIHHRAVRLVLGVIQDYCLHEDLPPLTILVVNQDSRLPGAGFIAWDASRLGEGRARVYEHPWDAGPNPFAFAAAGTGPAQLASQLLAAPGESAAVYRLVRDRGMAQAIFRRALLDAYGQCAFCGLSVRPALQAAHIIPWSDASDEQRMDVTNGLLLCATHHALFDARLLNVQSGGAIESFLPEHAARTAADKQAVTSLHQQRVRLPANPDHHPARQALEYRARTSAGHAGGT